MPRWWASRTTAVMSSALITAPEGLEGEFRMMSLVVGVTHHVLERDPVGDGKNNLVAMIDEHGNDVKQRVLSAHRGGGFFTPVIRIEVHGMTVHYGVLQLGGAADGG